MKPLMPKKKVKREITDEIYRQKRKLYTHLELDELELPSLLLVSIDEFLDKIRQQVFCILDHNRNFFNIQEDAIRISVKSDYIYGSECCHETVKCHVYALNASETKEACEKRLQEEEDQQLRLKEKKEHDKKNREEEAIKLLKAKGYTIAKPR